MNRIASRPSVSPQWIFHAFAIAGLVLAIFDSRFLILAAVGFFAPGYLAETGQLKIEEFELESRRRASHHAFIVAGVLLALVSGFEGCGQRYGEEMHEIDDAVPASFVLTFLVAVYYLSNLIRYWGARAAAFRILVIWGCALPVLYAIGLLLARDFMDTFPISAALQVVGFCALVLGAAWIGRRYPRPAAALVALAMIWMANMTGALHMLSHAWPWEIGFEIAVYFFLPPFAAIGAFLSGDAESS